MFKSRNFFIQNNSTEGVNETAVDLFATLTAVMMLITTVFFSTMTQKAGKQEENTGVLDNRYYLIDFGIKDKKKEKEFIKSIEKKVSGILKKIGNHSPSLWYLKKSKDSIKNILIVDEKLKSEYTNQNLLFIFNEMESLFDKKYQNVFRSSKHNPKDIKNYKYFFEDSVFKNIIMSKIARKNFFISFSLLENNVFFTWWCNKETSICQLDTRHLDQYYNELFETKIGLNQSFCKATNSHHIINGWIDSLWENTTNTMRFEELLNYIFKLISTSHMEYMCAQNKTEIKSSKNKIDILKDKYLISNNKKNKMVFKIKDISNPYSKWLKSKLNDCLNIINGKLSFTPCSKNNKATQQAQNKVIDKGIEVILSNSTNYPRKALITKIEGWVKIEFTITEYGKVVNPKIVKSSPEKVFNGKAVKVISNSKFKPKIEDGVAIEQVATKTIEFKLLKD